MKIQLGQVKQIFMYTKLYEIREDVQFIKQAVYVIYISAFVNKVIYFTTPVVKWVET